MHVELTVLIKYTSKLYTAFYCSILSTAINLHGKRNWYQCAKAYCRQRRRAYQFSTAASAASTFRPPPISGGLHVPTATYVTNGHRM